MPTTSELYALDKLVENYDRMDLPVDDRSSRAFNNALNGAIKILKLREDGEEGTVIGAATDLADFEDRLSSKAVIGSASGIITGAAYHKYSTGWLRDVIKAIVKKKSPLIDFVYGGDLEGAIKAHAAKLGRAEAVNVVHVGESNLRAEAKKHVDRGEVLVDEEGEDPFSAPTFYDARETTEEQALAEAAEYAPHVVKRTVRFESDAEEEEAFVRSALAEMRTSATPASADSRDLSAAPVKSLGYDNFGYNPALRPVAYSGVFAVNAVKNLLNFLPLR